ncbi:hypothetical protein BG011_005636 [Mortierella polycephala]|uniref:Uncharacterized protein n=1 Tax=Mortierella polycephala TaxID=41804 RepID=A0A9P6PVI6_9FUNG|nr:hypothetical protein BG011_005636 [Mortierella polycephala]
MTIWIAPKRLRVSKFFKIQNYKEYDDFHEFLASQSDLVTPEEYHNRYHEHLDRIVDDPETPEAVRKTIEQIKKRATLVRFVNCLQRFLIDKERKNTRTAVTSSFLGIVAEGVQNAHPKNAEQFSPRRSAIPVSTPSPPAVKVVEKRKVDEESRIDLDKRRRGATTPIARKSLSVRSKSSNPKAIEQPWHRLMECALLKHFGWDASLPSISELDRPGCDTPLKDVLYFHALQKVHLAADADDMNMEWKEAFVALSGIWHLYSETTNSLFGRPRTEEAKALCTLPELEYKDPDMNPVVTTLLKMAKEKKEPEAILDDMLEATYQMLADCPRHHRHAAELLQTIGEQGCSATSLSRSQMAKVFDIGVTARKCDCLLRVGDTEVGNFEAKRGTASLVDVTIQRLKNMKINKSISLELEKFGAECPPILNIHGATASVFRIKKFQDIWVAGRACSSITLPTTLEELEIFLEGPVYVLINLLRYYDEYAADVKKKKRIYAYNQKGDNQDDMFYSSKEEENMMEWDKVVFHTPTRPQTRRPSLADRFREIAAKEKNSADQ